MRVLTASDRILLIEARDLDEAMRWNLAWADVPGVVERVPGARTVLVRFDPLRTSADALAAALEATPTDAVQTMPTREAVIPVRYDGEDLDDVARLLSVSREELVRRHLAAAWRVAFSGFAPGFGYAVSGDPLFDVPRRSTPRTRVPAGSVGLAGPFTGVYPRATPGGWQLIGRTDTVMWDIDRDPPALLSPGTRVRFERAGREVVASEGREFAGLPAVGADRDQSPRRAAPGDPGVPSIEVVRSALQLLVQDVGRRGYAALGVSSSGAADRRAMRDANRVVGNAPTAAVLECAGATVLRVHGAGVAVITGAVGEIRLVSADGGARPVGHGIPFATADGDEVHLGHPERGIRYVIAVRGGVAAASVLGSRATDTLAGLGPAPLVAGDVVAVGRDVVGAVEGVVVPRALPVAGELVELAITLGPRDGWFTPAALDVLVSQEWLVTPRSDRVGIRLQGDVPLERAIEGELPSEGAVTGAVQVPPSGQPVLFGPDHPVTGGYPIVAALTDAALDTAGQLPPGACVRFRVV